MGIDPKERVEKLLAYRQLNQQDVVKDLGIAKQTVSALITEGRGLTRERIQQFCETYDIDARYWFGQLESIEQADLRARSNPKETSNETIFNELAEIKRTIRPADRQDKVAERVETNAALREVVEMIQFWDAGMLRRFRDIAYGFMSGKQYGAEEEHEKGDDGVRKNA